MRLFSFKPSLAFGGRKFKGLRGWAGKPTHPPLTDIPVGAYVIAPVLDVLSVVNGEGDTGRNLFVAATYVLIVGAIGGVLASLTGLWDWWKSTPKGTQAWRTANAHMAVMIFVSVMVSINILTRLGDFDTTQVTGTTNLILSLAIAAFVTIGATLGGTLVFDYEFNVEQDKGYAWSESERDLLPGEKPEGQTEHA